MRAAVRWGLVAPGLAVMLALGACTGGGDDDAGGVASSSDASSSSESAESESAETSTPSTGEAGDVVRPSVEELTEMFLDESLAAGQDVTPEQARCVAEGLESSELSDEILRAFAELDETYVATEEESVLMYEVTAGVGEECGLRTAADESDDAEE